MDPESRMTNFLSNELPASLLLLLEFTTGYYFYLLLNLKKKMSAQVERPLKKNSIWSELS